MVREGKDCTVVASGIMLGEALKAADALAAEGILLEVIDPVSIKPLDKETIAKSLKKTGCLVVAENHNKNGALYDAVLEVVAEYCPVPAAQVAVEDEFGEVGPQDYLEKKFGLTPERIAEKVKAAIARK